MVGIGWAMLAVLSASFILALPKVAAGGLSPLQITLIRYITGFATVAPLFLASRMRARETGPHVPAQGGVPHESGTHGIAWDGSPWPPSQRHQSR